VTARHLHTNGRATHLARMPSDARGAYRPLAEILERLSSRRRVEVRHRAGQGDIPYLPEDVKIEPGRLFFPGIGWVDAPGVDPAKLPRDQIEVFFVLTRGERYVVQVGLVTETPPTEEHKTLRRDDCDIYSDATQHLNVLLAGSAALGLQGGPLHVQCRCCLLSACYTPAVASDEICQLFKFATVSLILSYRPALNSSPCFHLKPPSVTPPSTTRSCPWMNDT
jgi:hypothetical protein